MISEEFISETGDATATNLRFLGKPFPRTMRIHVLKRLFWKRQEIKSNVESELNKNENWIIIEFGTRNNHLQTLRIILLIALQGQQQKFRALISPSLFKIKTWINFWIHYYILKAPSSWKVVKVLKLLKVKWKKGFNKKYLYSHTLN